MLYQRYGGDYKGVPDLKEKPGGDDEGIGFPLIPIFFPIPRRPSPGTAVLDMELFPITQAVSAGMWCLEQMNSIDPSILYTRCLHTDGHRWKLYEVHRTHVKKTKFFAPHPSSVVGYSMNRRTPRFFDDHEHMLSVIGMLRYAMGISENIVQNSDSYTVEELPKQLDPTRTI